MSTILLATDGTPGSAAAVSHAIAAARDADATLHVVAVRPPVFFGAGGPVFATQLHEVRAARAVAAATAQLARDAGVRACAHDVEGDGAAAIVALAETVDAMRIFIGHEPGDAHAPSVADAVAAASSSIPVEAVDARC